MRRGYVTDLFNSMSVDSGRQNSNIKVEYV